MLGYCTVLLLLLFTVHSSMATTRVNYHDSGTSRKNTALINLLAEAMKKTQKDFGPYEMHNLGMAPPQIRSFKQLQQSTGVDIYWSMTSPEREKETIPVRIPLFKGLHGYRLLIINKNSQARFKSLTSLEQLQSFSAGLGLGWPDVQILEQNGINVTTHLGVTRLLNMLKNDRYDYLSLSVIDPIEKLLAPHTDQLMIEPRLLLHYTVPVYFFVNPQRPQLAKRVKEGLTLAIRDGTFEKIFDNMLTTDQHLRLIAMCHRHKIELENPHYHIALSLANKSLWYEMACLDVSH